MKNFLTKFKFSFGALHKLGRHPDFDWYFSVSLVFVLFIISLSVSAFLYYRLVMEETQPAITVGEAPIVFDKEELTKVIDNIKKIEAGKGQLPSSVLADPS